MRAKIARVALAGIGVFAVAVDGARHQHALFGTGRDAVGDVDAPVAELERPDRATVGIAFAHERIRVFNAAADDTATGGSCTVTVAVARVLGICALLMAVTSYLAAVSGAV